MLIRLGLLASFLLLAVSGLAERSLAEPGMEANRLHGEYHGEILWPGSAPQKVRLVLIEQSAGPDGLIVATGIEYYRAAGRERSVPIRITVNPRTLEAALVELPGPCDRAQETLAGDPLPAVISADFKIIISANVDGGLTAPELVLVAIPSRQLAQSAAGR